MTTTFLICFDSKTDVFFADSEVNGKLFVHISEAENVRKINISIIGRAFVYFEVYCGEGVIIPFENVEYYININECLWEWNESNELSNGEHWFPFKFRIPSNAPANASEKYGHVQYYVKAEIEYYDKKRFFGKNYTEKGYCGFSVCPIIDLNLRAELKLRAYTVSTQTKRNCFSCATKTLKITISLPKTGFVCGETIPLQIDISNKTSMKIESLEFGISLNCLFTGSYDAGWPFSIETYNEKESLDVVRYLVEPTSNSAIYSILIPPLSPTFCTFLKIEYSVFVKVHTNAICESGPSASVPIIIGTVPLKKKEQEGQHEDTMTTKDEYLFLKEDHKPFVTHKSSASDKYSNLNLCHNYKCPILIHADRYNKSLKFKGKSYGTVSAMEIFKTADFIEGSTRCKIKDSKRQDPTKFIPKFACYSNLSSLEKLSSN